MIGIEIIVVGHSQNVSRQGVEPGRVLVDRKGVVPQADALISMYVGKGIPVGWGIQRQPLILHHAQTGFCYLVLMQQIFEAKYQPGDREMGVLCPKIGEVRVQLRIPDVVIGPFLLQHHGDTALGQQAGGMALIVHPAGQDAVGK